MSRTSAAGTEFVALVGQPADSSAELICIPLFKNETGDDRATAGHPRLAGELKRALASGEFRANAYEVFTTDVSDGAWKARRVSFIGGALRQDLTPERTRRIAATAAYVARRSRVASVAFVAAGLDPAIVADGLSAAEFDSGLYKNASDTSAPFPRRVEILAHGADAAWLADAVRRGRIIGESANVTRSLANEPGNVLTPRVFADRVAAGAKDVGLSVHILDETQMKSLGMHLLLGVAQGSAEPPRLIVIRHEPPGAPSSPVLGFIGKGVTFDSGGISIKPADGMERMKDDMAGGAAVAGAMRALALLGGKHRVIGVIPTVENMPGGRATRPGDVVIGASGKSVEIINTDAEGRLILADALWYAREQGATHLVDIATLTGACMVALGRTVSGLFGNNDAWVDVVRTTAAGAGDRVWPMPIYEEATEQLHSEIADVVNSAGRPGGAITAAAFLREFAGDGPWAHLDIAGTAWAEDRQPYQPKGATGVGVRTLVALGLNGA